MNHTMLQRRPSGYYYRQRVPDELRPIIGKNEIVKSLATNDHATARRKVKLVAVEVDRLFEKARASLQFPAVRPHSPGASPDATTFDATRLLAEYLEASLEADAAYRQSAPATTEDRLDHELETITSFQAEAREALALRRPTFLAQQVAERILADHSAVSTEEKRRFTFGVQQVILKGLEVAERRALGDWSDTEAGASAAASVPKLAAATSAVKAPIPTRFASQAPTINEVLEGWCAERKPTRNTEVAWRAFVRRFVEMNGDLPIDQITRRQIALLKDAVLSEGKGVSSVQKAVTSIKSILAWAVENGHIEQNPAIGIRVRDPNAGKSSRLPFTKEDVRLIFSATEGETGARLWLPRLGLYTAARLGELGQLTVADVKEEEGVWLLDINEDGEGKSLKTLSSKRKVPLHPALVDAGFLQHVQSLDRTGPLFPDLKPGQHGSRTRPYTKVFGRLMDRIGIKDSDKVFHSFRHTWKDAARAAGLAEDIHDAITGHSSGGIGRRYGQGFTVARLAEEMAKLRF